MKILTLIVFALFLSNQALACGGMKDKSATYDTSSGQESTPVTTYVDSEEAED
ncbi:MAG: hypothetical protein OEY33_02145 [Bdellovibrionales bacterium]|jgi:hypothetical protein|nr:hypothetical protein [Bdellovibrionales bacterium]